MNKLGADKPLVTLALFAYNQEHFIREAVEGAFSQTYSPLEIILSDDFSSDGTFEVIRELRNAYVGDHEIILNRNLRNLGVGAHVFSILQKSRGKYIVLFSGDDVSAPSRVERLVNVLEGDEKGRLVVHGAVETMDVDGNVKGVKQNPHLSSLDFPEQIVERFCWLTGTSVAFKRDLIDKFPEIHNDVVNEDMVWAFRGSLTGGAIYLDEPLVKYRLGVGVSSFDGSDASISQLQGAVRTTLKRKIAFLKQASDDLGSAELDVRVRVGNAISSRLGKVELELAIAENAQIKQLFQSIKVFDGFDFGVLKHYIFFSHLGVFRMLKQIHRLLEGKLGK